MTTLDKILSKEATNCSAIYLYQREGEWYAYESSAYLFTRIFEMGDIERINDCIRVAVSSGFEFLQSKPLCSIEITLVADDEVVIKCGGNNAGFKQWKQTQLI